MNKLYSLSCRLSHLLSYKYFLPACFVFFIGLRLTLILLVPVAPYSDTGWYFARAETLATTGKYTEAGIPTAFWPVGYPAFLAIIFRIFGVSVFVGQMANLVLAAGSFWLTYRLASKVFGSEQVARCAVLFMTFYPNSIASTPLFLTEPLYTFLLLLAVLLLLSRPVKASVFAAGTALGLATLVKTQTIALIPMLVPMTCWDGWSARNIIKSGLRITAVSIIALLVVCPWTVRNYQVFGAFIPVSTNGGISLLAGNNSSVIGDYAHDFSETDPIFRHVHFSVADQVAADRRARALAVEWIREHPFQFLALIPKKIFRLWVLDGETEWNFQLGTPWYDEQYLWFRLARILNQGYYFLILGLAIPAAWLLPKTRAEPTAYIGFGIALFFTLLCIVFSGQSRYHYPVMPFFSIYAAWIATGRWKASLKNN